MQQHKKGMLAKIKLLCRVSNDIGFGDRKCYTPKKLVNKIELRLISNLHKPLKSNFSHSLVTFLFSVILIKKLLDLQKSSVRLTIESLSL